MEAGKSFADIGFVSEEVGAWTAAIHVKHRAWFGLLDDLNREGMRAIYRLAARRPNKQHLIASLLFGRVLQSYQGVILLASRGMGADVRALIRSTAESAIALAALAEDATFVDHLVAAHELHTLTMANVLLEDVDCKASLSAEQIHVMREVACKIMGEYGGKPSGINWETTARGAGMKDLYVTVYREMSGDGAHVSVTSLIRHVVQDDGNTIESLAFEPQDQGMDSDLSAAASTLLCAMEALARVFDSDATRDAVRPLAERWQELSQAGSAK